MSVVPFPSANIMVDLPCTMAGPILHGCVTQLCCVFLRADRTPLFSFASCRLSLAAAAYHFIAAADSGSTADQCGTRRRASLAFDHAGGSRAAEHAAVPRPVADKPLAVCLVNFRRFDSTPLGSCRPFSAFFSRSFS